MTMYSAPSTRTSLLSRLLEGEHSWGSLETTNGHGVARDRLVVYPPGLDRDERVALRVKRAYSVWGLGLWILVQVPLMAVLSPWTAMAVATVTWLAVGAVIRAKASGIRGDVRTQTVVRMLGVVDPDGVARHDELRGYADRLVRADALYAAGELTAVQHEAEAWDVYNRLA